MEMRLLRADETHLTIPCVAALAVYHNGVSTNHEVKYPTTAPEHCADGVLACMGKPSFDVYERFRSKFFALTKKVGKEQYLVPYLMSSHPGSTLADAVELALCLKKNGYAPEQVQDYYPTPGTASTVMYYTGINPLTMKPVYVATDYHEKQLQRALLQFNRPQNAPLVREALKKAGREDLIGYDANCLVRPAQGSQERPAAHKGTQSSSKKVSAPTRGGNKSRREPGKSHAPNKRSMGASKKGKKR